MKKLQRLLGMVLAVTLMFGLMPQISVPAAAYSTVQSGSKGSDVRNLQTMLNAVNSAGLTVDGSYGPACVQAVKNYQSKKGLTADGICGPKTWAALEADYKVAQQAMSNAVLQSGSSGDTVKKLQTMLNQVCGAGLSTDGKFGPATLAALKKYQKQKGLSVDGICGPKTWAALEGDYNSRVVYEDTIIIEPSQTIEVVIPNNSCKNHKYSSATGGVCTVCGYVYEPEMIACNETKCALIDDVAVRDQPYAKAGKLVRTMTKGETVKVTHYFYNSLGSLWYLTSDGYYIYSERLGEYTPQKYTLTFDGNGSNVSNLPNSVLLNENSRYGIPGSFTGVPQRAGYTFLGYSTDKNATAAEYVPGKTIKMTKDITLYAVWEKNSDYDTYREEVKTIKQSIGSKNICVEQFNRIVKSGSGYKKDTGLCNVASVVTLLNRNLYYENKGNETHFTVMNAFSANGCAVKYGPTKNWSGNTYNRDGYEYEGGTGSWACALKYTNGSGTSYTVVNERLATIDKNKGDLSYEEYFAQLLRQHPEGICIRKKSGSSGHVCVITDYEIVDGKYQFYVQDPVNKFTGKWEDSYQGRTYGAINQNIDFVAYIK